MAKNRKLIKNAALVVIAVLALYNSVYFKSLGEHLSETTMAEFDAEAYAADLWEQKLQTVFDTALQYDDLITQLKSNPQKAFDENSNSLGIGNISYFKTQGEGKVVAVNENNVLVSVGQNMVEIETEFVFGNAVRDASELIHINEFKRTSEINAISEAINAIIRSAVIPEFREKVKVGNQVTFKGAFELNRKQLQLDQIEIIPVEIKVLN